MASAALGRLCDGEQLRMSIPADPDRDLDLLIGAGLSAGLEALGARPTAADVDDVDDALTSVLADPADLPLTALLARYARARRLFAQHDAVCQHLTDCVKCTQLVDDLDNARGIIVGWTAALPEAELALFATAIGASAVGDVTRETDDRVAQRILGQAAQFLAEQFSPGALTVQLTEAARDDLLERAFLALDGLPASLEMEEGAARAFAALRDAAGEMLDVLKAAAPTPLDVA